MALKDKGVGRIQALVGLQSGARRLLPTHILGLMRLAWRGGGQVFAAMVKEV